MPVQGDKHNTIQNNTELYQRLTKVIHEVSVWAKGREQSVFYFFLDKDLKPTVDVKDFGAKVV